VGHSLTYLGISTIFDPLLSALKITKCWEKIEIEIGEKCKTINIDGMLSNIQLKFWIFSIS
jgi:hypothetical protein